MGKEMRGMGGDHDVDSATRPPSHHHRREAAVHWKRTMPRQETERRCAYRGEDDPYGLTFMHRARQHLGRISPLAVRCMGSMFLLALYCESSAAFSFRPGGPPSALHRKAVASLPHRAAGTPVLLASSSPPPPRKDDRAKAKASADSKNSLFSFEWSSSTASRIGNLALPALGALALDPLMTIVDSIFVGRQSSMELAAVGLNAYIFTFTFFIVGSLLSTATGPLVAEKRASGLSTDADRLVDVALIAAAVSGVALCAALELSAHPLLATVMGGSGDVLPVAENFLRIRALAAPAVLLCSVGTGALRGRLDTSTPLKIAVLANGVNLALDCLLVVGLGWGAAGVACATGAAEWISAASYLLVLKGSAISKYEEVGQGGSSPSLGGSGISLPLDDGGGISWWRRKVALTSWYAAQLDELASAAAPIFARTLLLQLTLTLAAAAAARAPVEGGYSLAASASAHQVLSSLWLFASFALDSLAVAANALISDARGRGASGEEQRSVALHALVMGLGFGGALGLALEVIPPEVTVGVFTGDPLVVVAAAPLLHVWVAPAFPVNGVVFVGDGVMQGYKAFGYEAKAMLVATTVAGVAYAAEGLVGGDSQHTLGDVWLALVVLQSARAASFVAWFVAPWGLESTQGAGIGIEGAAGGDERVGNRR